MLRSPAALRHSSVSPVYIVASYLFIPWSNPGSGQISPVLELGWTLNYEMYFYTLFACSLLLPLRAGVLILSFWFIGSVITGSVTVLTPALRYLSSPLILEFAGGAAIAFLYIKGVTLPRRVRIVIGCVALTWLPAFFALEPDSQRAIGCGIPATMLVAIVTLGQTRENRAGRRLKDLLAGLGNCSYSLYLCHMFVIRGVTAVLGRFVSGPVSVALYTLICTGTIVTVAWASYRYLEVPSKRALEPRTQQKAVDA